MRIAMLPDYYFPHVGGMEIWTQQMAKHLIGRGHEVTVYTYKTSTRRRSERRGDLTIKRVGPLWVDRTHSYLVRGTALGIGLPPHLLVERYDAYLPTYSPLLLCKMLKRRPVIPVWHGYHGLEYAIRSKGMLKGAVRSVVESVTLNTEVDGVIAVSRYLKETLLRLNPRLKRDEVHVVYGGVDLDRIDIIKAEGKKPQICFIGRLVKEKHPEHALHAFCEISKRFPEYRLVIVGEGSLKKELEELSKTRYNHCRDQVEIRGYVPEDEKIRILKESLLLVRPSIMDAWPLTTLEALACKTPFVAYDIPPIREQIKETEGGIIVKKGDVEGLANAIRGLVKESRLTRKLASMGRKNVERKFTWERSAEKLEKALKSVQ